MKKKNKNPKVTIYLRPSELAEIDRKAKSLGWTRSALIRMAVGAYSK